MDERQKRLLQQGREHYQAQEWPQAEKMLQPLARERIPYADIYAMLGVIAYHDGRRSEAADHFAQALHLNPGYTEAAMNMAVTCNELGRYDEARDAYQKMLEHRKKAGADQIDPFVKGKIANMHADVAGAYETARLFEHAVEEYRRALTLCPDYLDLRTRLGGALREAGQYAAAEAEFKRVITENPNLVGPRLHLGMTYHSAGRPSDAAREWREVLAMEPENKFAKLYLRLLDDLSARK